MTYAMPGSNQVRYPCYLSLYKMVGGVDIAVVLVRSLHDLEVSIGGVLEYMFGHGFLEGEY